MSPHADRIRPTKTTKQIPKQNPEERPATHNHFKLTNLVLCVGLDILISTHHCIILICIISNEFPCE